MPTRPRARLADQSHTCRRARRLRGRFPRWRRDPILSRNEYSTPFKVLPGFFVFLRRSFSFERAEIPSLSGLRVLLSRIQPVTAGFKFSNHGKLFPGKTKA